MMDVFPGKYAKAKTSFKALKLADLFWFSFLPLSGDSAEVELRRGDAARA
jgi:hypothetical protein